MTDEMLPLEIGCVNCGEIEVPLNNDALCERCYIEFAYEEERKKQQEYADRLAWEKNNAKD